MEGVHRRPIDGMIGPYRIQDLLGSGGMGVVYKAYDPRLGRQVAVKVLLPEVVSDEAALVRFEREVRAVAALSHPNILAIYDFQRDGDCVYAAMELLAGGTLRERLKSGPLSPRKAVEAGIQIARGLAAAHEHNIAHRDLKPENIAFARDGQVKILDFGLAREFGAKVGTGSDQPTREQHTLPGMIMGTVGYMSPEQVRGQEVDHRSDLFAFGAVLYEMMTGRRAFSGRTPADTLSAVLNSDVKDVADSGVSIPPALDRVVRRCLEKDPGERFHSARDLAFALENATGSGWHPGPALVALGSRWSRWGRAALFVGAGLAAGVILAPWMRSAQPPSPVQQAELTHSGFDSAPSASPDGDSVAFASTRSGVSRIYRRNTRNGSEVALTIGPDRRPRYFADGRLLFLRHSGRKDSAWTLSPDSGFTTSILPDVAEATPSPDGQRVGFIRFRGTGSAGVIGNPVGIVGWKAADGTGAEHQLLSEERVEFTSLDWSVDGKSLAVVRRGSISPNRTAVVVVGLDSSAPRVFEAPDGRAYGALAWTDDPRRLVLTESRTTQVYVPGAPGSVVLFDAFAGTSTLLFHQPNLFSLFGLVDSNARIDVAGQSRVVLDPVVIRQNLEERDLQASNTPGASLTRGTSLDRQPAYAPGGQTVVFTSNRSSNLDLWLVNRSGTEYQLTSDAAQDWDPAFASDGALVWSSNRSGNFEVWTARVVFDANGTPSLDEAHQITRDGIDAQNPSVTESGWVIYKGGKAGEQGVWRIRRDGSEAGLVFKGALLGIPDVSPNGRYVLVRENDRPNLTATIRVVDIASGQAVPFTIVVDYTMDESNADITRGRARWKSGDAIMFVGQDAEGNIGIYEHAFRPGSSNGQKPRLVVGSAPGRLTESFDVSPDGKRIVVSFGSYARNVMTVDGVPGLGFRPPVRR